MIIQRGAAPKIGRWARARPSAKWGREGERSGESVRKEIAKLERVRALLLPANLCDARVGEQPTKKYSGPQKGRGLPLRGTITREHMTKDKPDESRVGHTPLSEDYLRAHTVGELKQLSGPIRVINYDPAWPHQYECEADRIRAALGERASRIEHVGSTSVPGLPAKPVIDIVLVVADSANEAAYAAALDQAGYHLHIREPGWYEHRLFKGPENSVNLHVFSVGCPEIDRMLTFRDWLRTSESDRESYARLKRALAEQEWKYTQNYADAKTAVIQEMISKAQALAHFRLTYSE